jgi:hypothetical protein
LVSQDGSQETAVLGYFITAAAGETTPVLETIFSHLDEIEVPGTTTEVAAIDLTDFQKQANSMVYLYVCLTESVLFYKLSYLLHAQPIQRKSVDSSMPGRCFVEHRHHSDPARRWNIFEIKEHN